MHFKFGSDDFSLSGVLAQPNHQGSVFDTALFL